MRRYRVAIGMVFVAALVAALPVSADESVTLPTLAPLRSMRQRFVAVHNGMPLFVCQEEWASFNQGHIVCDELVTGTIPEFAGLTLEAGAVYEYVLYEDTMYVRYDDQTTWSSMPNPSFDARATLNDLYDPGFDATLSNLGTTNVDDVSVTQYQFWSRDERFNRSKGGQAVYDLFLNGEPHVVKSQLSYRGMLSMGEGELATINTFHDFNVPIDVGPPPRRLVRWAPEAPHALYSRAIMPFLRTLAQR
jgi:hypothetical protein